METLVVFTTCWRVDAAISGDGMRCEFSTTWVGESCGSPGDLSHNCRQTPRLSSAAQPARYGARTLATSDNSLGSTAMERLRDGEIKAPPTWQASSPLGSLRSTGCNDMPTRCASAHVSVTAVCPLRARAVLTSRARPRIRVTCGPASALSFVNNWWRVPHSICSIIVLGQHPIERCPRRSAAGALRGAHFYATGFLAVGRRVNLFWAAARPQCSAASH